MSSLRVTGLGVAVLAVLGGAVAVIALGGRSEQELGLWTAAVVGLIVTGGAISRRATGRFGARTGGEPVGPEPEALDEAPADPEAWRRERERRGRGGTV